MPVFSFLKLRYASSIPPQLSHHCSLQHYPHQSFEAEVLELNKHFAHLNGASYVLGNQSRGLQWHLFYATEKEGLFPPVATSVEMCLTGLDPDLAQHFVRTEKFVDAKTTTYESGIADLLPGAMLDDCMFEPCGYSLNGLSKNEILTIHVTPEEQCSYASVEFSCLKSNNICLNTALAQVLRIFAPRDIHISLHSASYKDILVLKDMQHSLRGYCSDGLSVQYLSDGSHVVFRASTMQRIESPNTLVPSSCFSGQSDVDSTFEGFPLEEDASAVILDDDVKFDSPMMPHFEKRYGIENLGTVEMQSYVRDLIVSNNLCNTFYVMNLTTVQELYLIWRRLFPRIEPFYAVKCNPDPVLIRFLGSLGAGFDCASKDEIKLVLDLGIPPSKILFANACKHPQDIRAAQRYRVEMTTFDTLSELEKLKANAQNPQALLRIRADDPEARCLLGNKYGADMYDLPYLYQKARMLGIDVVGVSFHVGSGATNPDAFSAAIALAKRAFDIGAQYDFDLSILDIGGGFCSGKVKDNMQQFHAMQDVVNEALDHHFPVNGGVRIIAEPGRYFAETCATLACYIFGRRERFAESGLSLRDYWITDGLYGSFNCILYDHSSPKAIPLTTHRALQHHCCYTSTIFGPTCDGLDTVLKDCMLPDLFSGDWLLFPDMGAYTLAGASNFNGMNATDVKTYYVFADFEDTY